MKKTLFLLAILLTSPLHASQPTQNDLIQLPRGLASYVGVNYIPQTLLLLISRYVFGTTEPDDFLIAKKGRKVNKLVSAPIFNKIWIVPPGSEYPFTNPLANYNQDTDTSPTIMTIAQFIQLTNENQDIRKFPMVIKTCDVSIDITKVFWVSEEDCLCLEYPNEGNLNSDRCFEVCFLGKFCCITPDKISKNMYLTPALSGTYNNPHEQQNFYSCKIEKYWSYNYFFKGNKAYYKQVSGQKKPWVKNYPYTTKSSNNYFYELELSKIMVKSNCDYDEEETEENIEGYKPREEEVDNEKEGAFSIEEPKTIVVEDDEFDDNMTIYD